MKTSLVTGGAGFIGSNLVKELIALKHKVLVLDDLSTGFKRNLPPPSKNYLFYKKSINADLTPIFKKHSPDYVFHLAAQIDVRKSVVNPLEDAQINILGSLNLIQSAIRAKIKNFIYSSTGGALYGEVQKNPVAEKQPINPISCYGVSKYATEKYLETFHELSGLPYITLRYANVYGPSQNPLGEAGVVAIFINKLIKDEQPSLFAHGKNERDYVFVQDVVAANIKAMDSPRNKAYNIGTGVSTTTARIFSLIQKGLQSKIKPKMCSARPGDVDKISLDSTLAHKELSWRPKYTLEKGILKTVNWFLNQR